MLVATVPGPTAWFGGLWDTAPLRGPTDDPPVTAWPFASCDPTRASAAATAAAAAPLATRRAVRSPRMFGCRPILRRLDGLGATTSAGGGWVAPTAKGETDSTRGASSPKGPTRAA